VNIINNWQFNLVIYLISVVTFFQFYKLAVKHAKHDGAATILLQIIASISALFLLPLLPFEFPTDFKVYLLLLAGCVFYSLNDRLQTTARKNLEVSVISIVNQLSTVFLIIIGLTAFKEQFLLSKMFGAVLILLGNVLLFYKKGKIELNKYVWLAVLTTLVFAIAISIDIGISQQFNLPFYIMLTLLLPSLMIFFAEKIKLSEIVQEYETGNKKHYLITGISWTLAIFFSLRSFQFGRVTTIVPLQATSVLLNVIIAYFFLGERKDKFKKLISALLIVLGVYLTVYK
jgi:drug/metabolite transporter (DMT)-like permease